MIDEIREPIVKAYVLCPNENIGDILQLILEKRGLMDHTESLDTRRVMLHCELPLNEILVDFNDKIKSITRGYGSMDYEHAGYRAAKLVKLDLLVNGEPVDAFSTIVHRDRAESARPAAGRETEGSDPAAALSGGDPGGDRRKNHCARKCFRVAKKCDREMLRRRYHPQTQVAGEAKRRKKTDEKHRQDQHSAGSVHRGAESAMNLFVMSTEVETSLDSAPELARDCSTSLGMAER